MSRLEASEQAGLLAAIVTSSFDAIISKTPDGTVTSWNQAATRLFGFKPEEMIGRSIRQLFPGDRLDEEDLILARIQAGERVEQFETVRLHKDGVPTEVLVTISPVRNADGNIVGASKIARDISERKRAERRVARENAERLRLALDASQVGIWKLDAGSGTRVWDARCGKMFGIDPDVPVTHQAWASAILPEDRAATEAALARALDPANSHDDFIREYRIKRPDGTVLWLFSTGCAVFETAPAETSGRRALFVTGTMVDITERKHADAALRASEERLRRVLETEAVGVLFFDRDGTLADANDGFLRMTGYSREDVASGTLNWRTMTPPEWVAASEAQLAQFPITGAIGPYEKQYIHKDGKRSWMLFAGRDLGDGTIVEFAVDIDKRKKTEAALRESELRMRLAQDAVHAGTWEWILDGNRNYWSEPLYALYGHARSAVEPSFEAWVASIHPGDRERVIALVCAAAAAAQPFEVKWRVNLPRGEPDRWLLSRGQLITSEDGQPERYIGIVLDVTASERMEHALRASEEQFRGIYQHAGTGIATTDMKGKFLSCNPAYSAMLGYSEDELRELDFLSLVHPEDRAANSAEIKRLAAKEIPSLEIFNRYVGKSGKPIWVHKHVSLVRDAAGVPISIVALVTDMTERKRYEEHIRLLMREMNHRSKNMLAVVQAVARQTIASSPDDFMTRFGERVRALATAQDLLVKNEWRGVEVGELARSQLSHFSDLIGTRITLQGPPLLITAAASQTIGMALHELATNAGKYGALSCLKGRVEIEWRLDQTEAGSEIFTIAWRESGGPPVVVPKRQGFGSTVVGALAELNLGARTELNFASTGLSWRLNCDASDVLDSSSRMA